MDVWIVSKKIEFEVLFEPMERSRKIGCAADVEKEGRFWRRDAACRVLTLRTRQADVRTVDDGCM